MTAWRRWVFEIRAPADEFLRHFIQALEDRAVLVDSAELFDLQARAFGSRAFVKVAWVDAGLELRAKIKSGLFSAPLAMERVLLEAGREAQSKLTYDKEAKRP